MLSKWEVPKTTPSLGSVPSLALRTGAAGRGEEGDTGKLSDPEVGTVPFSLGLLALILKASWVGRPVGPAPWPLSLDRVGLESPGEHWGLGGGAPRPGGSQ